MQGPVDETKQAAKARLFVALWPDDALRAAIAAERGRWGWTKAAAPVRDDKLHLTLQFIGDAPRERLPAIAAALRGVATGDLAPIRFMLDARAIWSNGVALLAPAEPPAALLELQVRVEAALATAGIEPEARRWRPHVTLARCGRGSLVPQTPLALDWRADGFALVESASGPPSRYVVIERFA